MRGDIETSARELIERHHSGAIVIALSKLNRSIDQGDKLAREFWAMIVHLIHDQEGKEYAM